MYMPKFNAIIFTGINFLTVPFGRSVRTEILSILTSFQKLYAEFIYPKDTYRLAGAAERKMRLLPAQASYEVRRKGRSNMADALTVNREHKDTVFRMIYKEKKELLTLYNALNGTDYQNPEELTVTMLENAIYFGMKNDVSFLLDSRLMLYERQSTWNPNIPLRDAGGFPGESQAGGELRKRQKHSCRVKVLRERIWSEEMKRYQAVPSVRADGLHRPGLMEPPRNIRPERFQSALSSYADTASAFSCVSLICSSGRFRRAMVLRISSSSVSGLGVHMRRTFLPFS